LCDKARFAACTSTLVQKFGELVRKLWSSRNFKSTVSPHELLQAITVTSKKAFKIGKQHEAVDFLSWFLNQLERDLNQAYAHIPGKVTKPAELTGERNVIHQVFRGEVEVTTQTFGKAGEEGKSGIETAVTPFLFLSLELPPTPLFQDEDGGNVIPQVPLYTVLKKFDGATPTEFLRGGVRQKKTYRITKLPKYLIFHIKRFTKNNFFLEKNPTIVNFPLNNLEMRAYLRPDMQESAARTKYDLVANICHDSLTEQGAAVRGSSGEVADPLTSGSYRVHVRNDCTGQWYEIQDLRMEETMPQLIGLSESYLMIYRLQE